MKNKMVAFLFVGTILIFSISYFIEQDKKYSSYERRKLTTKEELKEDFTKNLEGYLSDQIFLRDDLISLNSAFDRYVLQNSSSNGAFIEDDFIIEKNYPLDEKSIENFLESINFIKEKYLEDSDVFYTIIPDKSYFLKDSYPKLNFKALTSRLSSNIDLPYIDVIDLFTLDDYYKTDIHIKQPSYLNMIKRMSEKMNFTYVPCDYSEEIFPNFYGSSYSKVPKTFKPDELVYLTSNVINSAKVRHLEFGDKKVYEKEKLESIDSYSVFLGGPSSIVEITNSLSKTNDSLIIFRDSFASSFAPLLIPYYKNITLIDLRYIKMSLVENYVDFSNKDVLFAYSTLLVNNSDLLKVK